MSSKFSRLVSQCNIAQRRNARVPVVHTYQEEQTKCRTIMKSTIASMMKTKVLLLKLYQMTAQDEGIVYGGKY